MRKSILFFVPIILFAVFIGIGLKQNIFGAFENALENIPPSFPGPKGCKDLCGDGICQEVTCMAIGCPCPETPETCPEDCGELKDLKQKRNEKMPNPAAVYCKDLGYKYEIREDPKTKGQYGVCIFPDKSECNAWAFYRGQCGKKWQKEYEEKCAKEGEKVNRNPLLGPTNKKCCFGLTEIRVSKSYSICVNCGDNLCKWPEDEFNCPSDCKPENVFSFPIEREIVVNPREENPVSIGGHPMESPLSEISMNLSVKINTKEEPVSVKININKEKKVTEIKVKDKVCFTKETLKFKNNELKIKTPEKEIKINALPNKAVEIAQKEVSKVTSTELKTENNNPIYEVKGEKEGKLLFVFPIKLKLSLKIDAKEGKILKIKRPWWSFLVF
ncbi:DUF333 domain-containing protein [bacterium]|nr:DUF333 domain-containing protein [bacterium]